MGNGSKNFDYSNNAFNHAGAFESMRFNSFVHAPDVDFDITIEFLEDLERIKKIRTQKEYILKIKLLIAAAVSFGLLMFFLTS
ncbi:MAG: hypothetical protein AAFQ94_10065 [Bacteroidota bacterium]